MTNLYGPPRTHAGRELRVFLGGANELDDDLDDVEDWRFSRLFLLALNLLARRRFPREVDGHDTAGFVARLAVGSPAMALPRREAEAVLWIALGDVALSDALDEETFFDIAPQMARLLVEDLCLSEGDLDALVGTAEGHLEWGEDHHELFPPPPQQGGRLADWDEWRRQMAELITEHRPPNGS